MSIENLIFKRADDVLIIEGHIFVPRSDTGVRAMIDSLTSFFGSDVHDKHGPIGDWSSIHVVVSTPQLLPIWKTILTDARPAIATNRLVVREEFGAVDFRSHFECIGILA